MKKGLSIGAIAAGGLILLSAAATVIGILFGTAAPDSLGVIGGADGPTTMIIAGEVDTGCAVVAIVIGILLAAAGVRGLRKIRKQG